MDTNQRWGFEYYDLKLYRNAELGGIRVYYIQHGNGDARIAIENQFNDMWVSEGWSDERYSYKAGWVEYHIAIIRNDHINIGWKKP